MKIFWVFSFEFVIDRNYFIELEGGLGVDKRKLFIIVRGYGNLGIARLVRFVMGILFFSMIFFFYFRVFWLGFIIENSSIYGFFCDRLFWS